MNPRNSICWTILIGAILVGVAGCYYPAKIQPPPAAKTETLVEVPYDLTWDAVHKVVSQNQYKLLADDPNDGIIETETYKFTLADADCGQMKSVANRFDAEPDAGGSAVYNFKVAPAGPEASEVSISATYTTPLHVPLHRITDFECVSRGTQEARLLKEIEIAVNAEHRPSAALEKPPQLTPGRPTLMRDEPETLPHSEPGGPSLLKPDFLKKPSAPSGE
jgi:hypothetical protein